MSGIRPRLTLPTEAFEQPRLAPRPQPSEEEMSRLRRVRRRTRAAMTAGLLLMLAGVVELTAEPLAGLALAGVAPLAAGLGLCAISENRFERLTNAERAARGLPVRHRPEGLGWFHFSGWEAGGGHTSHDSCGGGWFGGGGGFDGGGGGGDCGGGGG
jgi:uncharacterized membrane protein YgcG